MLFVKMNYIQKFYIFNNDAESGTFGNVYYYYFAQNLIVCVGFRGVQQTSQLAKIDSTQPNRPGWVIF